MRKFEINRGANTPLEFKGLKGQHLLYCAIYIIVDFLIILILYVLGLPMILWIIYSLVSMIGGIGSFIYRNKKYGTKGLLDLKMKELTPNVIEK
ncbi:MAG: DUF4133 domain-containing protein [Bacteroidota bacterium]